MTSEVIGYGGFCSSQRKLAIDVSFDAIRLDLVLLDDLKIASPLTSRAQPAVPNARDYHQAGS
jgi:hypothetical protein